jgi:hypothetical protein
MGFRWVSSVARGVEAKSIDGGREVRHERTQAKDLLVLLQGVVW